MNDSLLSQSDIDILRAISDANFNKKTMPEFPIESIKGLLLMKLLEDDGLHIKLTEKALDILWNIRYPK